jgi:protein-S-isoprenylcysteine O-methyltransferase Ste14
METKFLAAYAIIVGIYGWMDILVQKNSMTIIKSKSKDKTYAPIIITFIINLIAVPVEFSLFKRVLHQLFFFSGMVICLLAIIIRVKGQLDLKHAFSTRVELQPDHTLVKSGLYRYVRHPLYLAVILLLAGADIMFLSLIPWIFTLLTVYFIGLRIKEEESFLKSHLKGYAEYMTNTKKMIPYIW